MKDRISINSKDLRKLNDYVVIKKKFILCKWTSVKSNEDVGGFCNYSKEMAWSLFIQPFFLFASWIKQPKKVTMVLGNSTRHDRDYQYQAHPLHENYLQLIKNNSHLILKQYKLVTLSHSARL